MSVGPMGLTGGLAAAPLAQNRASQTQGEQSTSEQVRASQSEQRAEKAAGIGQTEEHGNAQDRDADGRRPWELPARTKDDDRASEESASADPSPGRRARDPHGERGNQLDVSG